MAIYHFTVKLISRSQGQSAVASAAYRRADKLYDERLQATHDYTDKVDVIHSELTVPAMAPDWLVATLALHAEDRQAAAEQFWNFVERHEHRKDAQIAREVQFALPIELTQEQGIVLARAFIQDQLSNRGMVADWAVHWDEGNPHVHCMLTTRVLTEQGFGHKERAWNQKPLIETWREQWAAYTNYHLALHQHDVRIDHRSYQDQGIDLIPTIHQGKAVREMEQRGLTTDILQEAHAIRRENLQRIAENPDVLVAKVAAQRDSFTRNHLTQAMGSYVDDKGRYQTAFSQSASHLSDEDKAQHARHAAAVLNEDVHDKPFHLTPDILAAVLTSIEQHESVFDERTLAKALSPYTQQADDFARALLQLQHAKEVIPLGLGDDGRARYTTRKLFELEIGVERLAEKLSQQKHVAIPKQCAVQSLKDYEVKTRKSLTEEQRHAVLHLIEQGALRCVVGRAGTGKSFSLGAAREIWEAQGLQVKGVALSGIAAEGLSREAGMMSQTIDSFLHMLKLKPGYLIKDTVLVMDEAGMTDSKNLHAIMQAVDAAGAKLVLVGDPAQLQPVGPGALFRGLVTWCGFAEIKTIYRQQQAWQREATQQFAAGRAEEALSQYAAKRHVHCLPHETATIERLVADWVTAAKTTALAELLVIAHRNQDVTLLNQHIRAARIRAGELAEGYEVINAQQQTLQLAAGDRLLFTKNDKTLGVKNGRFGTVTQVEMTENGKVIALTVQLDGGQTIQVSPKDYAHIAYGYAATVHKVQGVTVDRSLVYVAGRGWDRFLTYVAGSRHRQDCHFYASRTDYADLAALKSQVKRLQIKDSLIDYPLAFARRRGLDPETTVVNHLKLRLGRLVEGLKDRALEVLQPSRYWAKKEAEAQRRQIQRDREQQRQDAVLVARYVDLHRELGAQWQSVQEQMQTLGIQNARDPHFALLANHPAYQAVQRLSQQRDELACEITQAIGKYTVALELYGITPPKLSRHAEQHQRRQKIEHYQRASQQEKTVISERLAFAIQQDIKRYYPLLKRYGVDTKVVQKEAVRHERRVVLKGLTAVQRQAFYEVEAYRKSVTRVGQLYERLRQKEVVSHVIMHSLQTTIEERDKLAYQLAQNPERYAAAFNFYQIGKAAEGTRFNDAERLAQKRWYQLQEQSARYQTQATLKAYQAALREGNTPHAQRLAHHIVQDVRGHHRAVMTQSDSPLAVSQLWSSIRRDAAHVERETYLATLTPKQRQDFLWVERYAQVRRHVAQAWKEFFTAKEAGAISDEHLPTHCASVAKTYSATRDALAHQLMMDVQRFAPYLTHFALPVEELQRYHSQHAQRSAVKAYSALRKTDFTAAALEAALFLTEIDVYRSHLKEAGIRHRQLYRDIKAYQQITAFEAMTDTEKTAARCLTRYQQINRQSGRCWSQLHALERQQKTVPEALLQKAQRLNSKRNYWAAKLMEHLETITFEKALQDDPFFEDRFTAYLQASKVNVEKLQHQAAHHEKQCQAMKGLADLAQAVQRDLKPFCDPQTITLSRLYDSQHSVDDYRQQLHKLLQKPATYHYALLAEGYAAQAFPEKLRVLEKVEQQIATYQVLHEATSNKANVVAVDAEQAKKLARAQRYWRESQPIEHTLAERYLREHRGITGTFSKDVRYHPGLFHPGLGKKYPALLVAGRNSDKTLRAVQAIYLDPHTANKVSSKQAKYTYGAMALDSFGVLIQQGKHPHTIAVAEGPETALSVAQAHPDLTVYAVLGSSNFKRVPLTKDTKKMLFCADNDAQQTNAHDKIKDAAKHFALQGIEVWQTMPESQKDNKRDFNDVLREQGIGAIQQTLAHALCLEKAKTLETVKTDLSQSVAELLGEKPALHWQSLWDESQPLNNTRGEHYLQQQAGVDEFTAKSVQFHPAVWEPETQRYYPAILSKALGFNEQGQLETQGLQLTYLAEKTANQAAIQQPVQYRGQDEAIIMLQKPSQRDDRWFVALELETGIRIAKANPAVRVACVANPKNFEKNPLQGQGNELILCVNHNTPKAHVDQAVKVFSEKNFQVKIASPDPVKTFAELSNITDRQPANATKAMDSKPMDPDIEAVKKRFAELDKKLEKANQQSYLSHQRMAKEAIEKYALKIGKNKTFLSKVNKELPDIGKRIEQVLEQHHMLER